MRNVSTVRAVVAAKPFDLRTVSISSPSNPSGVWMEYPSREKMKKVLIASDHAGFDGKEAIKKTLDEMGVQYEDVGTGSLDNVSSM